MSIISRLARRFGWVTQSALDDARSGWENQYREAKERGKLDGYREACANGDGFMNPTYKTIIVNRLSPEVFEQLRKQATQGSLIVTGTTTELQAGQMLGVQHVLNLIRDGITVEQITTSAP